MRRHREVAAAPARSAGEAAESIAELLRSTLTRSDKVDPAEVEKALGAARPALLGLIAGGHLDDEPLVLVAPPVHLSVSTVSGDDALTLADMADVPGGAGIDEWTIHLPPADPLGEVVRAATGASTRLSAEPAPEVVETKAAGGILDETALRSRLLGS
jgi:hypothetical protein